MPKWHSITDDFPGSSLSPALWAASNGTLTIAANRMGLETTVYSAARSVVNDLVDSYVALRMEPDAANTTLQLGFDLGPDYSGQNYLSMWKTGTLVHMASVVAGVVSDATVTYDAVNHAYWRIRQASGTNQVFFETSVNGSTWTTRRTITTPFAVTAVGLQIWAGNSTDPPVLWDDGSPVLWDDGSPVLWA